MALMRSALKICPLKRCWSLKTCYGPPPLSTVRMVLGDHAGRGVGGRGRRGEEKKKFGLECNVLLHFIQKCSFRSFQRRENVLRSGLWLDEPTFQGSAHTTHTYTDKRESRESEGRREGIKDDESKWGKKMRKVQLLWRVREENGT